MNSFFATAASILSLIISAAAFWVSFQQFKEAKRSLFYSSRAWLQIKDLNFGDFTDGQMIHITAYTENVGHEPALRPAFRDFHRFGSTMFGVVPVPRESGYDSRLVRIPNADFCKGLEPRESGIIFPGQRLSYDRIVRPDNISYPSHDEFQSIKEGKAIFFYRDCVSYITLGEVHLTSTCHYLMRRVVDGMLARSECVEGNDAN